MNSDDAHRSYERATTLYKEGKLEEALDILEELSIEHSDSKHVMYSRGLCLIALGRMEEARALRDALGSHRGNTAKKLRATLDLRIKEKEKSKGKPHSKPSADNLGKPGQTDESVSRPRSFRLKVIAATMMVAALAGAGGLWLLIQHNRAMMASRLQAPEDNMAQAVDSPDRRLELTTLFPAGTQRSFTVPLFVTPTQGVTATVNSERSQSVGAPVAANWDALHKDLTKAITLASAPSPEGSGLPLDKMVITAVVPRDLAQVSAALKERNAITFSPGKLADLAGVIAECGKADHAETWNRLSKEAGLEGTVYWWGSIGLAVDANEKVSHILLRSYPGDRAPSSQGQTQVEPKKEEQS